MTVLLLGKSLVIVMIGFVLTKWIPRSSAERHATWLMTFVALIALFVLSFMPAAPGSIPSAFTLQVDARAFPLAPDAATRGVLTWLWPLGTAICLTRLLFGSFRILRLIRSSKVLAPGRDYEIRETAGVSSPVAWGLGRKVVLLPESACTWDEERRSVVLNHEVSHLRRNDAWALLTVEVACALFWLNPLVWIAASRLRREQEHAADDDVLNDGADPITYADHLVALARVERTAVLTAGVVSRSNLTARVEAILDRRRARRMPTRRTLFASALALAVLMAPLVSLQAQRKIYKSSEAGITPPKTIHKVEPGYTQEAKDAKIQGQVVLNAVVDVDGKFKDIKVERGLDAGLDAKAVAAIEQWVATPAQKDGEPVPVFVNIEVNFTLLP